MLKEKATRILQRKRLNEFYRNDLLVNMNKHKVIEIGSVLNLIGSVGLLIWWFLMPLCLPVSDSVDNFKNLVLDRNWIPVNLVGLVSSLFLTLGFPTLYLKHHQKFKGLGFVGLLISSAGLLLFTCIQYYETLLWPAAAQINPELVQVEGALVTGDIAVVAGLITSGIMLGMGYIIFGIAALRTKAYPGIPLWFIIIGTPVFGNGIVFPVRTVGLLLLCVGTIWLTFGIRRN